MYILSKELTTKKRKIMRNLKTKDIEKDFKKNNQILID